MAAGMYTISARTIIGYRVLLTIALPVLVLVGYRPERALSVVICSGDVRRLGAAA